MAKPYKTISQLWAETEAAGDTHISRVILNELEEYAKMRQFYPVPNALYSYMTKPRWNKAAKKLDPPFYPDLKETLFRYWFRRLVGAGYIEIDDDTRAIRCIHLQIIERDGFSF